MAALRANKIISIPLKEAIATNRTVGDDMIEMADGLLDIVVDKVTAAK